jgi:hypothetical protein
MVVLPIVLGFRTLAPRQSAGQLNANEALAKGKQLRPSRPHLEVPALARCQSDYDTVVDREHTID